jgi:O-antigen ligase
MNTLWLFPLAACFAAIAVVMCLAVLMHYGHCRENGLMPCIFYQIVAVIVLSALLSGRNLYLPAAVESDATSHPLVKWFTSITSIFFILIASERIARRFFLQGPLDTNTILAAAFWIFFLTNFVVSAIFGTHPSFSFKYAYWALISYAALLITPIEGESAIRYARNALFALLIVSALCIPWRPEMVLSREGWMLLPGLDVRYAGLSTHPNSLAPEAIAFLLCLWSKPYSRRWLTILGWMIGLVSLLLTQSKTNWVAFALCASCIAFYRLGQDRCSWRSGLRRSLKPVLLLFATAGTATAFGLALMITGYIDKPMLLPDARADLLTLVGRTQIWDAAIQEWRNNPLFGYGLTIWNDEHRAQLGLDVYTAHNQFYESLASAGITGVAGLAIYATTLLWFAIKSARASGGLSLALFLLIFIRSITEVTLSDMTPYSAQMIQLLLLMTIVSAMASSKRAYAREQDERVGMSSLQYSGLTPSR